MKKILLTAAAVAAISTSAFANDMIAPEWYLRADVGAAKFNKLNTDSYSKKSQTVFNLDLGLGYYINDKIRAELIINKPFLGNAAYNKAALSVSSKPTITALFARVTGDVLDLGIGKVFVTGGLGLSYLEENFVARYNTALIRNTKTQKSHSTNLAWTIGAGASFDVTDSAHLNIAYGYRDYGKSHAVTAFANIPSTKAVGFKSHNISTGLRFDI